jgi:polyhydroxybutyrate depolymerase
MAVPALVAMWQGVDGCPPPAVTTAAPVTTSVATCPAGRSVELVTIAGAGHQWPGSPSRPAIEKLLGLDPPSTAFDATDVIWRFFADHRRA